MQHSAVGSHVIDNNRLAMSHRRTAYPLRHRNAHVLGGCAPEWAQHQNAGIVPVQHVETNPVVLRQPVNNFRNAEFLQSSQIRGGPRKAANLPEKLLKAEIAACPQPLPFDPPLSGITRSTRYSSSFKALVLASLAGMIVFNGRRRAHAAFLASCGYLLFMLVAAAAALYPVLLPSSDNPASDITFARALAGSHALHVGLAWSTFGIALALLYFITSYRMFRGKVSGEGGYGH